VLGNFTLGTLKKFLFFFSLPLKQSGDGVDKDFGGQTSLGIDNKNLFDNL
jgi:hypothetical protein